MVHAQAADGVFSNAQNHHAVSTLLRWNLYGDRLKTFRLVGFLKCGARLLDILRTAARSEEGVNRPLDLDFAQMVGAENAILLDKKRSGRGHCLEASAL